MVNLTLTVMPNSFKYRLKKLPLVSKFVLFGSMLAIIGVFLPWYRDIDKFNTGDVFLGITGPLYLAGIIVLLSSIVSFGMIALRLLEKPVPKLPLKEEQFYVFSGSLSILMLVLTVSVFFHNKFGVNLIDKSIGIGMMMTFIGCGLVLLGAIIAVKNRNVSFDVQGHLEPLIDFENRDRQNLGMKKGNLDEETLKVKSAVQESIDDFTKSTSDIKDIR